MPLLQRISSLFARSGKSDKEKVASVFGSAGTFWGRGGAIDAREAWEHFDGWAFAAIHRIASIAATNLPIAGSTRVQVNPFQAYKPEARIDAFPRSHPLCELIRNPNGPQTGPALWYQVYCNLLSSGSAPIWVISDGMGPVELWSLPAFWVRPETDGTDVVTHYSVSPGAYGDTRAATFNVPADQMIVPMYPSMLSPLRSNNPTKLMGRTIDMCEAVLNARIFGLHNGVHIGSTIEFPDSYQSDPGSLRQLVQKIQAEHAGPYGQDKPCVLPPGVKVNDLSSAREASYNQSAQTTRDEVFAIFGATPTLMGFIEDANQSIVNANLYQLYTTVLKPLTVMLAASLTEKLGPNYGNDAQIVFPYMVPDDRDAIREDLKLGLSASAVSVNEMRDYIGLPRLGSEFDKPMAPMGMAPMDGFDDLSSGGQFGPMGEETKQEPKNAL